METAQANLWNRLTADPTYVAFHMARIAPVFAITPADLICLISGNEKLIRMAACRVDVQIGQAWIDQVSQYTGIDSETIDLYLVPMIQGYYDTVTMNDH